MKSPPSGARTAVLTCAALAGFAANSLLCRSALGPGRVDASTFTGVRLLAGALTLALLVRASRVPPAARRGGSWTAAAALFAYAAAFSFAYLRLGAGVGALLLFGAVQATMIGWGLRTGERPRPAEWLGLGMALAGLVGLTLPGLSAPDPAGAALMLSAGVAWGIYSLRGREASHPLAATADNFARGLVPALALAAATSPRAHLSLDGILLAAVSGSITSGVAYTLWYAALAGLTATRAAVVQLAVPVLAATGGVALLGEAVTPRVCVAGAVILGGVALALSARR